MLDKEAINAIAMQMILHSGKARRLLDDVMEELSLTTPNQEKINDELNQSHELLVKAHNYQNKAIFQADEIEYSLLLTHAQDTLMSVETSMNLIKQFVKITFKKSVDS